MLWNIILIIAHRYIGNIAIGISNRCINRIYKTFVWCNIEVCITVKYLSMQLRINFHAIFLHQVTAGLIVALTLYTLDFSKQLTKKIAKSLIII